MQAGTAVASGTVAESNLTDLQYLYWIGHQLRPSATHFNNAFSFTFHTPICSELFARAFGATVCEYDALRTIFKEALGVPQQVVLPTAPDELHFVDLSLQPSPTEAAEQWQLVRVQRPFSLDECLYDTALLKLTDSHFVWFLNQHHLITDASSFFLIAERVLSHYEDYRRNKIQPPAAQPTFARYAASLKRQQQSSRAQVSRLYWQQKVNQRLDPFAFYGRAPVKEMSHVTRWTHSLSTAQTTGLISLAEAVDLGTITPEFRQFCLTASLFLALLHHLTENAHLGFVTTIHNRATQVNRHTVGVLMELCPVQVTFEPSETIASLMQKVAAEMKELLLHYRHGGSRAASDLALDVMFTFVQRPSLAHEGQQVVPQIIHPGTGSERLGLHVHHLTDSNQYDFYLDLHQDIFSAAQMAHAQQSLQVLIAGLSGDPTQPLDATAIPWPASDDFIGNGRSQSPYEPPTTPMEAVLQQIWQEVLARSPIGVHDDFFALGGESWQAMRFLSKFEAKTGHHLPLSSLLTSRTIAGLAKQIDQPLPPESILQVQPGEPDVPPLFLIPGAAGNTLAVQRVAQNMSPSQSVYTFQLPSLDFDNLPEADVHALANYYLESMQAMQPHGPYKLGGYSAGGIFAFEVAQQLRAQGESVSFLAIIDMPAPHPIFAYWWQICQFFVVALNISSSQEEALFLFGRDCTSRTIYFWRRGLRAWLGKFGRYLQHLWRMPLPQKWHRLQQKLRGQRPEKSTRRRPILRDMDPASLTDPRAFALFTLYDRAARNYLPRRYDGKLTLVRCPLGYGRKEIRSPYPDYGWHAWVRQLETHVIHADGHLALMQEPAVAFVGQKLQTSLDKAIKKEM
jgi:thioesterase domain-containing protein